MNSNTHVVSTDPNGVSTKMSLDKLPDKCPFCHNGIHPVAFVGSSSGDSLQVMFCCPLAKCRSAFIGYYRLRGYAGYYLNKNSFGNTELAVIDNSVKTVSVSFVEIYEQAFQAEKHGLLEVCGVGYRKALEFLIKDYAILKKPEDEEKIKKTQLGNCIKEYVTDARLKSTAEKATWLGNDETHYERKWKDKDLSDLKILLGLTMHWIIAETLTEAFEADMSGPAPA